MDVILLMKSLKSSSKRMESNTLPLPHIIIQLIGSFLYTQFETKQTKPCLTSHGRTVPNYKLGDAVYSRNFGDLDTVPDGYLDC